MTEPATEVRIGYGALVTIATLAGQRLLTVQDYDDDTGECPAASVLLTDEQALDIAAALVPSGGPIGVTQTALQATIGVDWLTRVFYDATVAFNESLFGTDPPYEAFDEMGDRRRAWFAAGVSAVAAALIPAGSVVVSNATMDRAARIEAAAETVRASFHATHADRSGLVHWEVSATAMKSLILALALPAPQGMSRYEEGVR